jgi:dUTP pyrophosphatase
MLKLKVKKLVPDAIIPTKARESDEGYDVYANLSLIIPAGKVCKISTGIAAWCDGDYWLQVEGRSGLASRGQQTVGGIVDKNYRGEVAVLMANISDAPVTINKGDKIAQLIIRQHFNAIVEEVNEIDATDRGSKGFGSSGN